GERQRRGGDGRVVGRGRGRAVGRRHLHRHLVGGRRAQGDGEDRRRRAAVAFGHRGVVDRDGRHHRRFVVQAGDRGRVRRAQDRPRRRRTQRQVDRLTGFRGGVIDDGDVERLTGRAGGEGERAAGGRVVARLHGGAVGRGEVHRGRSRQVARAGDR